MYLDVLARQKKGFSRIMTKKGCGKLGLAHIVFMGIFPILVWKSKKLKLDEIDSYHYSPNMDCTIFLGSVAKELHHFLIGTFVALVKLKDSWG